VNAHECHSATQLKGLIIRALRTAASQFSFSTIRCWYQRAIDKQTDPVGVLRRKVLVNARLQHLVTETVLEAAPKDWSVELHHDNLVALVQTGPDLEPLPSYATLRRSKKANCLDKRRRLTSGTADCPTTACYTGQHARHRLRPTHF
jgi:hypothetical protein